MRQASSPASYPFAFRPPRQAADGSARHDAGTHLSLGSHLIAKVASRPGGERGTAPQSVGGAKKPAGGVQGAAGEDGEAGSTPPATYWEYENDNVLYASSEDNSDGEVSLVDGGLTGSMTSGEAVEDEDMTGSRCSHACLVLGVGTQRRPVKRLVRSLTDAVMPSPQVYRIYPVNSVISQNVMYALRFRPLLSRAVEVVRSMRVVGLGGSVTSVAPSPRSEAALQISTGELSCLLDTIISDICVDHFLKSWNSRHKRANHGP
jgi:hypothetical protein